jgi:hypothetical protein
MHSRAHATLTTARSEQIMRALGGGDAPKDARCTACHSPFQSLPAERLVSAPHAPTGVSCQNCHGAAESWLLAHTRTDYSHGDRVRAGMREMRLIYERANVCVACHQNVSEKLLAVGHPELIFELDGQTLAEPRHWIERRIYDGPKAWLVGQIVALREMVWKEQGDPSVTARFRQRRLALEWLLSPLAGIDDSLPEWSTTVGGLDAFARAVSILDWDDDLTADCFRRLARRHGEFLDRAVPQAQQARRAERLVLAIDRLAAATQSEEAKPAEASIKRLFAMAQSLPDFLPDVFARELEALAGRL